MCNFSLNLENDMFIFLSEQDGGAAAECSLKVSFLNRMHSLNMFKQHFSDNV